MSSIWDWIDDFVAECRKSGEVERLRLVALEEAAMARIRHEPAVALELLAQGRALADQLQEPWWALFFDHWRLQVLLHHLYDYRAVLDLAVRATLEARKPQYAALPQRICLHEDLIYTYVGIDPAGYADAIRQALAFMGTEAGADSECRFCIQGCATEFALQCGRLDEAEASARRALTMAEDDPLSGAHHSIYTHCDLCTIAHRRGDWDALRDAAAVGEELARRKDNVRKLAEFLVWRALLARRENNEEEARRFLRQAILRLARTQAVPPPAYFDALCAFYEQGYDLDRALKTRTRELEIVAGKGRLHQECRARVERCRLLKQMGLPADDDLAAAREAARKLRDPAPHLETLDRIEAGN